MLNKGNQTHNLISSSGSGTVINYGSGSDFLTSYGSGFTSQNVTVPSIPVPVPQHCLWLTRNVPYLSLLVGEENTVSYLVDEQKHNLLHCV